MSNNRASRLRILVLRDPGFQLDGQDTGSGEITRMLEQEPSFKVTESAAGYGEAARAAHRGDIDLVVIDEVAGEPAAVVEQLDQPVPEIPVIVLLDGDQRDTGAGLHPGRRPRLPVPPVRAGRPDRDDPPDLREGRPPAPQVDAAGRPEVRAADRGPRPEGRRGHHHHRREPGGRDLPADEPAGRAGGRQPALRRRRGGDEHRQREQHRGRGGPPARA